jgi:UPF0755 protein
MKKKVAIVSIIALPALFVGGYFLSPIKTKRNLKINSNEPKAVIEELNKRGYSLNILDELYMNLFAKPLKGYIYINSNELPRYKFLTQLSKKSSHYVPITIIPGETTTFVLKSISKKLNLNLAYLKKFYRDIAPFKEGNFLADTYNIPLYFNEKDTINFLVKNSFKRYEKIFMKRRMIFSKSNIKRYIIIASIIQKEAANTKEMPLIASVIYNRLKKGMRLQMDGTLNYGEYSHSKVTPERIKNDKSFYNTYKFKGLPKEPVCNVSTQALKSALNPAKTDYLYFMKRDRNSHSFSKEYKSHLQNIKERKRELNR